MRKCSKAEAALVAIGILTSSLALGALPNGAGIGKSSVESMIRGDLNAFRREKRTDFQALVQKWERVYGSASAPALLRLAKDGSAANSDRYVAILAHARVRGPRDAGELLELLGDRDWMVRSAALKAIEILGYAPAAPMVFAKLAKDPALVIRLQSIDTLMRLRPPGLADALVEAAMDGQNYRPAGYRKGRADWIPQKALAALRELKPAGYSRRLLPLMNETTDGRVRAHALHTIEVLEAKSLKAGRPFPERAAAWTSVLQASR